MENERMETIINLACRTILGTRTNIPIEEIEKRVESLKRNCTAEEQELIDKVYKCISTNDYIQIYRKGEMNLPNIMVDVKAQVIENKEISNDPIQNAREEDFEQMYLPELLIKNSIQYVPCRNVTSHIYPLDGQTMITIYKIGSLNYTVGNTLNDSISHYKIVIRDTEGNNVGEYMVYADIIIAEMDNPSYRDFVLHELLKNQENKAQNSFGYVGEVEKNTQGQNVSYSMYVSKEQYTAVRLYETIERERAREKQEIQSASERGIK